jgi:hypothetical protein
MNDMDTQTRRSSLPIFCARQYTHHRKWLKASDAWTNWPAPCQRLDTNFAPYVKQPYLYFVEQERFSA